MKRFACALVLALLTLGASLDGQQRFAPPKVSTLTGLLGNQGDIVNLVGTGDYLCSATTCTTSTDWKQITYGAASGAPSDATYIVQTANSGLSAEQALGALATGLMNSTTTTGVVTTLAPTDDNVVVGSGTAWALKALTSCSAASSAVTYNTTTNAFGCNTITSAPAGSDTEVQFNNATAFGASSNFKWDNANQRLTVLGKAGSSAARTLKLWTDVAIPDATSEQLGAVLDVYGANSSTGTATFMTAASVILESYGGGPVTTGKVLALEFYSDSAGADVVDAYLLYGYVGTYPFGGGGTITNAYGIWINEINPVAKVTNPYYLWFDSPAVYRINGAGVMAYYNPTFAKYTPAAANYERIVQQWTSDVAEFGTEVGAGGGNVQRKLRLLGANLEVKSTLTPAVTNTSANSCGTSAATIAGNDNVFKVTVGATSGTSCTVTFATAFANAPSCTVSNETTANLARTTSTVSTVILAGVFVAGDVLAGSCLGR